MAGEINDNLVLICGESAGGKSASLMNIEKPEGVMYLNCEASKKLPFASKFKQFTITDPLQVYAGFRAAEEEKFAHIHTIIVDSLTFLMDMYESVHVLTAERTMQAWGGYQQFFKNLMQQYVSKSSKNVIFTAHVLSLLNENEHVMEKKVPIKGALKNTGIESFFSVVVSARKVPLNSLEGYKNDLLTITPEDERIGLKYVYQTKLTKETVHERIRAPMGMFQTNETFINNDAQALLNRLREYYQ